jgi:DNA-binding transcriptional MerR regulator
MMSDQHDKKMTIREMCDAFDVTPRTLRFSEAKELLFPIREGQKRWVTRRDRARLKLILQGKRFGFSLEDIRQLLDLYDTGGDGKMTQLREACVLAKKRLGEMEAERDALSSAIEDLRSQLDWGTAQLSQPNLRAAE